MSTVTEKVPRKSIAHLTMWAHGGELHATCQITKANGAVWDGSATLKGERSMLGPTIAQTKSVMPTTATTVWTSLSDPLAAPKKKEVADEFKNCMELTISAGSALFTQLSKIGLEVILRKIDEMPEGSVLKISTDTAFFPWEILYPLKYSKDYSKELKEKNPLQPKLLWGYRYVIHYNLLPESEEGWESPVDEHQNGQAFVSLNLNPTIDEAFKEEPFKPIAFHQDFYNDRFVNGGGEIRKTGDEIRSQLLSDDNHATIIYLYCHGSSNEPFNPEIVEALELDKEVTIRPQSLEYDNTYARGPIVILNSCSSASQSPLSFSSFHSTFRSKRAMGIIGTTIQIPATFAAAFGKRLIEMYLDGVAIGIAIHQLRRELIMNDNPLGLFYSLQCPYDITAPSAEKATL